MRKISKLKISLASSVSVLLMLCLLLPFSAFATEKYSSINGEELSVYINRTYSSTYADTEEKEKDFKEFAKKWQETFITENEVIKRTTNINEKNYYIVKTIYNFLSDNTFYDRDVQKNTDGNYGPETEQFKNSHSAYGAAFGYTLNEAGLPDLNKYVWDTYTDSTGLTRIKNYDQGLAVCDGYSQFTKYICTLNGIECENIHGEFSGTTEEEKDRHEWNVIKLYPSNSSVQNESEAKWYYFDATYAATSSKSLKLVEFSFVDYSYFLRGSSNKSFTTNHQQLITEFSGLDTNDYEFTSAINIEGNKPWVILTRRPNENNELKIENYFFISPENSYFKLEKNDEDNYKLTPCDNDIEYDGNSYYYNINIQNLANGIEYILKESTPQPFKDAGKYTLSCKSIDESKELYVLTFDITPLDMSKWEGYQHFMWGDGTNTKDLINTDLGQSAQVEFRGATLSFTVEIKDVAGQTLTEGTNYVIRYKADGNEISAPVLPGSYCIEIDFNQNTNDNYQGTLNIPFEIIKGDFSKFQTTPIDNITFGDDILKGCGSLDLSSAGIEFKNGVDYTVALQDPSRVNFGDEGYIIYTALPTSNYLKSGTQLYRNYKVSNQRNLSSYDKKKVNRSYTYTGNAILLDYFDIIIGDKTYTLYNNRDYVIISYRNNVNVGTGYVTVQFIGNFCGQAELGFQIYKPEQNPSNPSNPSNQHSLNNQNSEFVSQSPQVSISVQDNLTYNGTPQTPSAVVTVNGVALISGVDYSVSALPAGAGAYECIIQGLGQYSYINHRAVVFINPAKITGGNTKPSSTSTVTISWNGQGEKCYYEVYTYDAKKKQWVLVAKTKSTSFKTNYYVNNGKKVKVKGNSQYKYRVRAYYSVSVNGKAYTKYGDFTDISGVTKISAPASPKAKKGKKSFKLSWKAVTNASGYEITYATDSKFKKNKKICKVNKGKTTSATIKKLKAGKTYYVKVRAYQNVNGKKVYSGYTKTIKVKVS
ncbi:MAG: fibronectin type III domain-containing protein [Eubacteriales bacterium]|nr:fibronectin type III domain-containing protein [Eubacteriales bacterium]